MDEITFWSSYVKLALNNKHMNRVAWKVGTSTRAGIPDVSYRSKGLTAWIELKYLPSWPVRPTTPIHLDISPEQRAHLREWCEDGYGNGFVLLLVAQDVICFPWHISNTVERDNITESSCFQFHLKQTKGQLASALEAEMNPNRRPINDATWVELP